MKALHTSFVLLLLLVLLVLLAFAPGSARAEDPITVDKFDAITTATLTVTSSGFASVDIATPLGLNSSTMQRAVLDETITVEVFAQDDGTSNKTKCQFRFFNGASAPTSGDLDGSTTARLRHRGRAARPPDGDGQVPGDLRHGEHVEDLGGQAEERLTAGGR